MNNIQLLRYSIRHPEPLLDDNYMFVEKHKDLNKYCEKTKQIKNLLITIKELTTQRTTSNPRVLNSLFLKLALFLKQYAQFSEFGCFINACDTTVEIASKDFKVLKKITGIYLKNRDLNEIVPQEWIQALIDKTSSRKKGQAGEEKLITILRKKGYVYSEDFKNFMKHKNSVSRFKKDFSLKAIKKNFKVSMGKESQNKKMDLCIKKGKEIYFLEAKHISISGGAQNKQIKELIDIAKHKISNNDYHQVSFLDGVYFNMLFIGKNGVRKAFVKEQSEEEEEDVKEVLNKIQSQKADILTALKSNKNNYFINTTGFKKLF